MTVPAVFHRREDLEVCAQRVGTRILFITTMAETRYRPTVIFRIGQNGRQFCELAASWHLC